jgi:hypothetical protein
MTLTELRQKLKTAGMKQLKITGCGGYVGCGTGGYYDYANAHFGNPPMWVYPGCGFSMRCGGPTTCG